MRQLKQLEDYELLKIKQIIEILDGDTKFGKHEFGDGVEIDISMPYLSGPTLCGLSTMFGLPKDYSSSEKVSRWKYLEELIGFCVENGTIENLIAHLFRKDAFFEMFKNRPVDEYESAYKIFVTEIIGKINILLVQSKKEMVCNGDNIYLQSIGDNKIIESFDGGLKKGNVVYTAFNEYTLEKQIGQGGNGKVWRVKDKNGDFYAIKFLERKNTSKVLKRFKNETFFCIRHSHKNILEILDYGTAGIDFVFYVMPLFHETLRDKIKSGLEPDEIVEIFVGVIEGLAYAHGNGAIHRDIKPENILFRESSSCPVIADFGIAHFEEDDLATIIKTKKGDRMANFMYAAPEQRKKDGESYPETDIYAAALLLNEMFTHEVPQAGGYKTIEDVNPGYAYLDRLFEQLFQQNPHDRLYPEAEILKNMALFAEQANFEKEKKRLQQTVIKMEGVDESNYSVISVKYDKGRLMFDLGKRINDMWLQVLNNELGSYTSILGYGPEKVSKMGDSVLVMPLSSGEQESTIRSIVGNVKDWVRKANPIYNSKMKRQAELELKAKEQEKARRLKEMEQENRMKEFVASL